MHAKVEGERSKKGAEKFLVKYLMGDAALRRSASRQIQESLILKVLPISEALP